MSKDLVFDFNVSDLTGQDLKRKKKVEIIFDLENIQEITMESGREKTMELMNEAFFMVLKKWNQADLDRFNDK